ncbi:MAG: bifunctional oligoribonuclease/PAP phosphatase NrnA [Clostridia bacterium]|nr:bifunctional oligoribonuclease/PAP phosphatase NrnA [Clostridia bacterium]
MLDKIAEFILNNDNFVIIPHRNPDGDCLGSAVALAYGLRGIGKAAYVSLPNEPGERLLFLWNDELATPTDFCCDVCIAVDVAAEYMMAQLKTEIFDKAPDTICLDHHGTNTGIADMNYIDANAAAAGEIVYALLVRLGCNIDIKTASALYAAIASDTGSFRYSNTTGNTHRIAAQLVECGIDSAKIMQILFETKKRSQLEAMAGIISNMEFYFDGKVCVTYADQALLDKYGVTFDGIDEYVSVPRTIEGVEVGIFLKCYGADETKVSLRSNDYVNVSEIAASLGGGGHIRAAGVTINDSMDNAKSILLEKIKTEL